MRQYLVFVYNTYYPNGGMLDFRGDYNEIFEAKNRVIEIFKSNEFYDLKYNVIDIVNNRIVACDEEDLEYYDNLQKSFISIEHCVNWLKDLYPNV